MMFLRRLLFLTALLLSVACVCVASEETKEAEDLSAGDGDCRDTGKEGSKCKPNPEVVEDSPECKEHSEKEKCTTEDGKSEGDCPNGSELPCTPKEPAPTSPKEPAPTIPKAPGLNEKGSTEEVGLDTVSGGPTGERGTDGSRQGSGTHIGSGPVSSSAPPTVSPPSQSTTNEERRDPSPTDTHTGNIGGSTTEESGALQGGDPAQPSSSPTTSETESVGENAAGSDATTAANDTKPTEGESPSTQEGAEGNTESTTTTTTTTLPPELTNNKKGDADSSSSISSSVWVRV
ncbi:uncharacterized protein TM35_001151090, partial [Trypanosoma theileri]